MNTALFVMLTVLVAVIAMALSPLPKGTAKPKGLVRCWRCVILVATAILFYEGRGDLPHFLIISPLLTLATIVLLAVITYVAARQNSKHVWRRLLATFLLDLLLWAIVDLAF